MMHLEQQAIKIGADVDVDVSVYADVDGDVALVAKMEHSFVVVDQVLN